MVTAPDGTTSLVVGAPLGRLGPRQLDALLDAAGSSPDGLALRLTPWRDVVLARVPDAGRHLADLAASGLVTDAGSPWRGVTACTGRPGCAKALADVHADAAAALAGAAPGGPVHWSGCGRRCGHPAGDHVDVLATPTGYAVDGAATASGGLAATVGAARAHHRTAARA